MEYKLEQVEAIVQKKVPEKQLLQIAEHPYIDTISIDNPGDSTYTRIKFKHYVSDEMIAAFLRIHSGLNIRVMPRPDKKVVIKMDTWRTDLLVQNLEMIIYVEKATVLSPYLK